MKTKQLHKILLMAAVSVVLALGLFVTVYAAGGFTLTYSRNGGTGTMSKSTANAETGKVTIAENKFTRKGYDFNGWNSTYTSKGSKYSSGETIILEKNTTIYAQWKAHTYTVVFNANGGKGSMENQSFTYGTASTLSANTFTKDYYAFNGWNTKADGSGTSYKNKASLKTLTDVDKAKVTLYAQWKPISYSVIFNRNNGSGTMSSQKMTGTVSANLRTNIFTRVGYDFVGWNTKKDGSGTALYDCQSVLNLTSKDGGSVNLYAQWKAHKYTVVFNANGGKGSMSNQAFTYGTATLLTANSFQYDYHVFTGWNTKADGSGKSYKNKASLKTLTDVDGAKVTLYAQWRKITYSVIFNKNGGSGTMSSQKMTGTISTALKANTLTREGYDFIGWNTKKDGSGTAYKDKSNVLNLTSKDGASVYLYAQWKAHTYTVAFNANGGSGTMTSQPFVYGTVQKVKENTFTRGYYLFKGWNTKADGSGKSYKNQASLKTLTPNDKETVTLYAQWVPITYTLRYDKNGGSGTMKTEKHKGNESFALTANAFTRKGYDFVGWNTAKDGSGTSYSSQATVKNLTNKDSATVTLYAQWRAHKYTISFNANGGTGSMANLACTYGTKITITANTFKRTNYTFTGWNTKADGSGKAYRDKAIVSQVNSESNGNTILYAQWSRDTYTVKYFPNGATGTSVSVKVNVGDSYTIQNCPFSKSGYYFAGWNTSSGNTGKYYANGTSGTNFAKKDKTFSLYAQWLKYSDVKANNPYFNAIKWATDRGYYSPSGTTFSPSSSISRMDVAKTLWLSAGSPEPAGGTEVGFSDVPYGASTPEFKAILWAHNSGIFKGTKQSDGKYKFYPTSAIDRQGAALVIWRFKGMPMVYGKENIHFADLVKAYPSRTNDHFSGITWLVNRGIVTDSSSNFGIYNNCTRADFLYWLYQSLSV